MNNIHLNFKELFIFGIWQKIRLTKNSEITIKEITQFAAEVINRSVNELGITFFAHLGKDLTLQLINDYKDYIKFENDTFKLDKNITPQACIKIFCPNVPSKDLLNILIDENIGKKVFEKQSTAEVENIK